MTTPQSTPETIYIVKRETALVVTPDASIVRSGDSTLELWQTAMPGQTLVRGGYVVNSLSLMFLKLPLTASFGETIEIYNEGYSNFSILQDAGQQVALGDKQTTLGVSGSITSTAHGDLLALVYLSKWTSTFIQGNLIVM